VTLFSASRDLVDAWDDAARVPGRVRPEWLDLFVESLRGELDAHSLNQASKVNREAVGRPISTHRTAVRKAILKGAKGAAIKAAAPGASDGLIQTVREELRAEGKYPLTKEVG
jgi:hypothetical protein